jgi:hypothetical protein
LVKQWHIGALLTSAVIAVPVGWLLAGCGGGGGSSSGSGGGTPTARKYQGTQGTGDAWSWTIGASTFSASDAATGDTYSGTWTTATGGFEQMSVTSTTDPSVSAGTLFYGLELPNSMFVAEPPGLNTRPMIAAGLGDAPAGSGLIYNFIHLPETGYNPSTGVAFGTMDVSTVLNTYSVAIDNLNISGGSVTGQTSYTLANATGLLSQGVVTGGISTSGVVALDFGTGAGGDAGLAAPSGSIDIGAAISATYSGFQTNPVDGSVAVSGAFGNLGSRPGIVLGRYTNVAANAQSANYALIDITGQTVAGQLSATVTYEPTTQNPSGLSIPAVFVASQVNGKYVLFGIGDYPAGAAQAGAAQFVLVQQ